MPRHTKKVLIKVPMRQTPFVAHEGGVYILSATELMVTIRHVDRAGNDIRTVELAISDVRVFATVLHNRLDAMDEASLPEVAEAIRDGK